MPRNRAVFAFPLCRGEVQRRRLLSPTQPISLPCESPKRGFLMRGRKSDDKVCFPAHSPGSTQNLGLLRIVLGLGDEAFREKRVKRRQPPCLRRGGQRGRPWASERVQGLSGAAVRVLRARGRVRPSKRPQRPRARANQQTQTRSIRSAATLPPFGLNKLNGVREAVDDFCQLFCDV